MSASDLWIETHKRATERSRDRRIANRLRKNHIAEIMQVDLFTSTSERRSESESTQMPSMQTDQPEFEPELLAMEAARCEAFDGLKLGLIKRELATLLKNFGRGGIFAEYTTHDISHINEMLRIVGMIVPEPTKKVMTPTDWLTIVLSIYFHDAGMIVTEDEFRNRRNTEYSDFEREILTSKDSNVVEFRTKIARMERHEADRFLYQEYVRKTHATRIRAWVAGERSLLSRYCIADQQMIFEKWLHDLPSQFREKLGLVCESHHLDDLNDFKKYPTSMPFGRTEQEQANIHYCALILRSADLLHMTSDRTPSVAFQIIAPTDPISQREWAKQRSVTSIRPARVRNADGEIDRDLQSDAIEVHAHYDDPEGFFALSDFLRYVDLQLKQSYGWAKLAYSEGAAGYAFPWRRVDSSNVEARGFLSQKFEFTIDQKKILELLTGHTLYNDSKVVIRELVQNAIDAVRVQQIIQKRQGLTGAEPSVKVYWDANTRTLEIMDNGTGMTQATLENHFLKVGNSRYQDAEFQKMYPGFSPISRFGIGVLSCFMVSDNVEISTFSPEEEQGRHVKLKSVHGQYLVRMLDKASDPDAKRVGPHGTIVRLQVRQSVDLGDIFSTLSRWVVVPPCKVSFFEGQKPPISIGWRSVQEALTAEVNKIGVVVSDSTTQRPINQEIRILRTVTDTIDLCFAVQWSEYFQQWAFLRTPDHPEERYESASASHLGMCVEGVRITSATPGYSEPVFFALANLTGSAAPRTNVARTDFESTPELDSVWRTIYGIYVSHVNSERRKLVEERGFSESWSVREARILAEPLFMGGRTGLAIANMVALNEQMGSGEFVMVESSGVRKVSTTKVLREQEYFWTIDSQFFRSTELLLEEYGGNASVASVLQSLGDSSSEFPSEPVLSLTGYDRLPDALDPLADREVDTLKINGGRRRVDLRWRRREKNGLWVAFSLTRRIAARLRAAAPRRSSRIRVSVPQWVGVSMGDVNFVGLEDSIIGVDTLGRIFLSSANPIGDLLAKIIAESEAQGDAGLLLAAQCVSGLRLVEHAQLRQWNRDTLDDALGPMPLGLTAGSSKLYEEFMNALWNDKWRIYNVSHWIRSSGYTDRGEFEF